MTKLLATKQVTVSEYEQVLNGLLQRGVAPMVLACAAINYHWGSASMERLPAERESLIYVQYEDPILAFWKDEEDEGWYFGSRDEHRHYDDLEQAMDGAAKVLKRLRRGEGDVGSSAD